MNTKHIPHKCIVAATLVLIWSFVPACRSGPQAEPNQPAEVTRTAFAQLSLPQQAERWAEVQRAVAHTGVVHNGAFYGSRSYWHTGLLPGNAFAFEQVGDLNDKTVIDGKGAMNIVGDVNADLRITGEAIVLIRGSLNATLTLQGNCEVIIADNISADGAIACDGTLHAWVGGDMSGLIGSTRGITAVIAQDLRGLIRCGEPACSITVLGDAPGKIIATPDINTILSLRVEGYMPTPNLLDVMAARFTRVNASIGESDSPPGLYPDTTQSNRPATSRWVVHRQRLAD